MEWNTVTIEDFEQATREILEIISRNYTNSDKKKSCVLCLHGDLGSGKTTMTQLLGKLLGVTDTINSPTFVIKKNYKTSHELFTQMIHMDAYRLEGEHNLDIFHLDQDITSPNTLMIIEWSELIPGIIPDDAINIVIEHIPDGRKIILK